MTQRLVGAARPELAIERISDEMNVTMSPEIEKSHPLVPSSLSLVPKRLR